MRYSYFEFSTLTPIQMCDAHDRCGASSSRRSARLVRIWYVCWGLATILLKTRLINSNGTPSWKRSDIELTKMVLPTFQRLGNSSEASSRVIRPFHLYRPPVFRVRP